MSQNSMTLVPVSTGSSINESSPAPLREVENPVVVYSNDSNSISITCHVFLPGDLNPETGVTVKQFYDPETSNKLTFYVILNTLSSSGVNNQTYTFDALDTYSEGRIDLSQIEDVEFMAVNKPPTTSRKTSTTVNR